MLLKLKQKFISKNKDNRLYQLDLPIIGLTGGISTGKSTVAEILKQMGFNIVSADQLVKTIYATDEAKIFIKREFPDAFSDDQINFKKLREIVFTDPIAKKIVEEFIYSKLPLAFTLAKDELIKITPNIKCLIYDVPLLFEKGLDAKIDLSVCVYLPRDIQKERLMKRDQITADFVEKILAEQWDIELKKSKSDAVILNTSSIDDLKIAVAKFIEIYFD